MLKAAQRQLNADSRLPYLVRLFDSAPDRHFENPTRLFMDRKVFPATLPSYKWKRHRFLACNF